MADRKIVAFFNGPFVGTDEQRGYIFPHGSTDDEISNSLLDVAMDHYYSWDNGDYDDGIEPEIDWHFEDYDEKKHDMMLTSDFEDLTQS